MKKIYTLIISPKVAKDILNLSISYNYNSFNLISNNITLAYIISNSSIMFTSYNYGRVINNLTKDNYKAVSIEEFKDYIKSNQQTN